MGSITIYKLTSYVLSVCDKLKFKDINVYVQLRHEYTLCRLYVVSGSSRAFDRRPRNMAAREMTQGSGDSGGVHGRAGAASTSSVVILDDHAGSSSHRGTTAVTIAEDEPIWLDWEQFNWDEFLSP